MHRSLDTIWSPLVASQTRAFVLPLIRTTYLCQRRMDCMWERDPVKLDRACTTCLLLLPMSPVFPRLRTSTYPSSLPSARRPTLPSYGTAVWRTWGTLTFSTRNGGLTVFRQIWTHQRYQCVDPADREKRMRSPSLVTSNALLAWVRSSTATSPDRFRHPTTWLTAIWSPSPMTARATPQLVSSSARVTSAKRLNSSNFSSPIWLRMTLSL